MQEYLGVLCSLHGLNYSKKQFSLLGNSYNFWQVRNKNIKIYSLRWLKKVKMMILLNRAQKLLWLIHLINLLRSYKIRKKEKFLINSKRSSNILIIYSYMN